MSPVAHSHVRICVNHIFASPPHISTRTQAFPHARTSPRTHLSTPFHTHSCLLTTRTSPLARACTLHMHRSELFPPLSSQWLASGADLSTPPSFAAARSLPSALTSPRRSRSQPHRPVRLGHSFPPHIPGDTRRGVAPPTRGSRELPGFPVLPNSGGSGDCGEAFLILAGESAHLMPKVSLLFLYLLPGGRDSKRKPRSLGRRRGNDSERRRPRGRG